MRSGESFTLRSWSVIRAFVSRIGVGMLEVDPEIYVPISLKHFSVDVVVHYGNTYNAGVDYVHITLCSPSWIEDEFAAGAILRGQRLLLMKAYDGAALRRALENFASQCVSDTVDKVYAKLGRLGAYEYEDYGESSTPPPYYIDKEHEGQSI